LLSLSTKSDVGLFPIPLNSPPMYRTAYSGDTVPPFPVI
jgi:hypothetical protein